MADYMAAEIWIGGSIPRKLVRKLCDAIAGEDAALEWGDARFRPAKANDLLHAVLDVEGVPLFWLCYERARYGKFSELELFLEKHGIPFDRASEGTCEFDPDLVQFRPGMPSPLTFATNRARQRVVERKEVQAILAMLKQRKARPAITALKNLVGEDVPPLPPFTTL